MKLTINSQKSLVHALNEISELFDKQRYLDITIVEQGKSRSLDQNATSHCWYEQVSKEEGEYTAGQVKCLCKYHFGLPILRADDAEFNAACVLAIDPLSYENKIAAMEYWPVTSLMKTKQMTRYLHQVRDHYAGRVDLKFKSGD